MATDSFKSPRAGRPRLIGGALFILVAAVYSLAVANQFVNFDDFDYVTHNAHVTSGLTGGIAWAFTAFHAANWHPLTWISHMLDVQLFGMNPWGHHLTSLLLHAANTSLLFFALFRTTGALWRSAVVAALFGLHPLHVESVAWVSERKDVLSTLFLLLTLLSYARYARSPHWRFYLLTLALFAAGLMAKPMLVTLPFLLLLLDFWPLGRIRTFGDAASEPASGVKRLLLEKVPFLAVSLVSSIITIYAQKSKAMMTLENHPLPDRIANAVTAYAGYLGKMLWPAKLAALYPLPDEISLSSAVAAGVVLAGITVAAVICLRRFPWMLVGWAWFLGTLVPVIGLVQVGVQSMADRYTYIPLIGLFVIVAWGGSEIVERFRLGAAIPAAVFGILCCLLSVLTWTQVSYWHDTETLFRHAIAVTDGNWFAHTTLGMELDRQGKRDEAQAHLYEALRLNPRYGKAHYGAGVMLSRLGRSDQAVAHYQEAIRLSPEVIEPYSNLASILSARGEVENAVRLLKQSISVDREDPKLHYNLAVNLEMAGQYPEAVIEYREALRLRPEYAAAHNNLGFLLIQMRKTDEAVYHLSEAVRLDPRMKAAAEELAIVSSRGGGR